MLMRLGIVVAIESGTLRLLPVFLKNLMLLEGTGGEVWILMRLGMTGGLISELISGPVATLPGTLNVFSYVLDTVILLGMEYAVGV